LPIDFKPIPDNFSKLWKRAPVDLRGFDESSRPLLYRRFDLSAACPAKYFARLPNRECVIVAGVDVGFRKFYSLLCFVAHSSPQF